MGLLRPAVNQSAYLKAGMLGFQGSGKTFTASSLAIGLCHLIKNKKAAFFDTETGSDYMIPRFKEEGLELFVHKGRAFADLCAIVREAESEGYGVLIIDSISHVWREIQDSYKKQLKRKQLYMPDWGILKGQWQEFTDLYLNSKLHIIMLGRSGYEYDQEVNDAGKKELVKVGTKMKVEGEMAYEPSLLIEMDAIKNEKEPGFYHLATVLKDRSQRMNGMQIKNPSFEDFMPIINFLNLGGEHIGVDTTRNSTECFESPDRSYEEKQRRRSIALEEIQEVLVLNGLDGRSAEAQKKRTELLIEIFGTSSKTYLEEKVPLPALLVGLDSLRFKFAPQQPVAPEPVQEKKDEPQQPVAP